ncbi:MAG: DUF4147 domain-containing protein [Erythrobacter sp.]|jgi:hydroxypyruvate reductase|nr:DUF4147 domain-containing protein [Erythrobacter sp.]
MIPSVLLRTCFDRAVETVRAEACLPPRIPSHPGRTGLIGIGKAGADMARVALSRMEVPAFALAITRHSHVPDGMPHGVELIEAGHPHPDDASLKAGALALERASTLGPADRLLALVSGGGSAVLVAPAPGIAFSEKQRVIAALHAAGAPIGDINAVRAALSAVKGGRLGAAANGAEILTYVISDVPGDAPGLVASGPTVPPTDQTDYRQILCRYGIAGPDPGHPSLPAPTFPASTHVIARADDALAAAERVLRDAGYAVVNEGGTVEGDAAALGRTHGQRALAFHAKGRQIALLSGGETTVALPREPGRGGRNATYLLSLALTLDGAEGIHALAADTDGLDGSEDNAGATCGPDSLARMRAGGIDPAAALARADAYAAFAASDELLITGPTLTNVNDLRIVLIDP